MDNTPRLPAATSLSGLDRAHFAAAIQPLFEASEPLATALYERLPYHSWAELIDRAEALARELPEAQRVAVVNAHPRLGESAAALRAVSPLSFQEQGHGDPGASARAAQDPAQGELAALNRAYEERFGFRFVVFVAGRPVADLVPVLRERLRNPRDEELATALRELFAIARDRLRRLAPEP